MFYLSFLASSSFLRDSIKILKDGVLPDVVNGWSEIIGPVGECTMRSIFDAKSSIVGVMDTHARFVVLQMVASFRITGRAMKIRAPAS